ncbi:MAG TPA: beta-ketoacyl-[acyl-carrier-protein] synthase family protein, partial [Firmicutes bacterium]|nr:beta-ketoacyl-[acyl-carrier-protein] synthase family protein [Bacillota bacterium]
MNRVLVTGFGPAASTGIGKGKFIENLFSLKAEIKPIPSVYELNYKFRSRFYTSFPEFTLNDYGVSNKFENIIQDEDKLSILCSALAFQDAGFKLDNTGKNITVSGLPEDAGVILGIGLTGLETALHSYLAHIMDEEKGDKITVLENFPPRYNRMIIPRTMTNSIAGWTSILFGLHGPSFTVNASCASGTIAVGEAYEKIKSGVSDLILAGGIECFKEPFGSIMRGFDVLGALTTSDDGIPRPFSEEISGFLFSEGAGCVLVLESEEHALKRGAEIYAEIVDYKCNSDAYNIVQLNPDGKKITELLEKLKSNRKIDYLNAHGTGTEKNDVIEAECIRRVFGDKDTQPVINSTKGILGHSIGASGALECAVTAYSVKESKVHGNLIRKPMENLNLVRESGDLEIQCAASVSYGFGGHNAGIVFKHYIK